MQQLIEETHTRCIRSYLDITHIVGASIWSSVTTHCLYTDTEVPGSLEGLPGYSAVTLVVFVVSYDPAVIQCIVGGCPRSR